MRRSHDSLSGPTCSVDKTSGSKHLRHHISKDGFYKGEQIIPQKVKKEKQSEPQN